MQNFFTKKTLFFEILKKYHENKINEQRNWTLFRSSEMIEYSLFYGIFKCIDVEIFIFV